MKSQLGLFIYRIHSNIVLMMQILVKLKLLGGDIAMIDIC